MALDTASSDDGELSRQQHAPAYEETREDEVKNLMEMARKLCLVEDPEQEPYRSKYKAREALTKARHTLVGLLSEDGGHVGVSRSSSQVVAHGPSAGSWPSRKIRAVAATDFLCAGIPGSESVRPVQPA